MILISDDPKKSSVSNKVNNTQNSVKDKDSEIIQIKDSNGENVQINLKDYIIKHIEESNRLEEESSNISDDYEYHKPAAKLWPDLDLDKVIINKKAQFNEFVKLYSAMMNEEFTASIKGNNQKRVIS